MLKINSLQSVSLDTVRLFAAQAVLVGHLLSFYGIRTDMPYIQNMGVVLFFVLSGLIISYTVLYKSQKSYSFKEFFIERFARIYSGLVPSLLFILLLDSYIQWSGYTYHYGDSYDVKTFLGNLLMLQDYHEIGHYFKQFIPNSFLISSFGSGRPLWTLAIEWWLYMFFGLIYFYRQEKFSWRYFSIFILLSIVPLWNMVHGRGHGLSIYWSLGIIITFFVFRKQLFSKFLALFFLIFSFLFSIMLLLYVKEAYNLHFVFLVASSLFFMLLYQQNNTKLYSGKLPRVIKFGASYSFTLYLIHYTIIDAILSFNIHADVSTLFWSTFFLTNILAAVLAYYTEMRHKVLAMALKRKLGVEYAKQ